LKTKEGKNNHLVPETRIDTIHDHLVTYLNHDTELKPFFLSHSSTKEKPNATKKISLKSKKKNKGVDEATFKEIKYLVEECLSIERADDREKWVNVGNCLQNIEDSDRMNALFISFSAKSSKFQIDAWTKILSPNGSLNLGTLHFWAKEDNIEKYNAYFFPLKGNCVLQTEDQGNPQEQTNNVDDMSLEEILATKNYAVLKSTFEKLIFKIKYSSMFFQITEYDGFHQHTIKDLQIAFSEWRITKNVKGLIIEEAFIDKWQLDPFKRTYKKIDFLPPPMKCPDTVYNIWNGFAVEKLEEFKIFEGTVDDDDKEIQFMNDHLKLLCDFDEEVYQYVLKYFAHMFQFPGILPEIVLTFISEEGVGKDLFAHFLMQLIGENFSYYSGDSSKEIFGRFSTAWGALA